MVINNKGLVKQLEGVIDRLEDVVFDNTTPYDADEEELQGDNIALKEEVLEEIEGAEAAFLVMQRRMDAFAQTLEEEIENLRRILERLEEGD